jgi:hypothetical protein
MTSYGDWIDNFKVVDRNLQQQVASNYGIHQLQRIKGSTIDYAYRISRAADTATLTLDINFIVVQTV